MPARKSLGVGLPPMPTPEIMLLATSVVPDVTELITIPYEEPVPVCATVPMEFPVTTAPVTSLPVNAVKVLEGLTPRAIPKQGELNDPLKLMPEIVLFVI